jgi:hypothetical protein
MDKRGIHGSMRRTSGREAWAPSSPSSVLCKLLNFFFSLSRQPPVLDRIRSETGGSLTVVGLEHGG